jgi:hypothetical protein
MLEFDCLAIGGIWERPRGGGAMSDPRHSERPITRMDQGISNRTGIDSIILNKKYVLQCSILRATVHVTKSTQDFAGTTVR